MFTLENFDWQLVVAWGLIALAAMMVFRHAWLMLQRTGKSTGCGSCGKCPANKSSGEGNLPNSGPLVQLNQSRKPK